MMRIKGLVAVAFVGSLVSFACGKDDAGGAERPKGRGSTACQAWQKALCDFAALECKALSEAACVDNYYGVTCASDETAQSCVSALEQASCGPVPAGCDPMDIADPEPAIAACDAYVNSVCQRQMECGGGPVEECIASARTELDCSKAIAYGAGYDVCLGEVKGLACSAAELPQSCNDVIKLSQ